MGAGFRGNPIKLTSKRRRCRGKGRNRERGGGKRESRPPCSLWYLVRLCCSCNFRLLTAYDHDVEQSNTCKKLQEQLQRRCLFKTTCESCYDTKLIHTMLNKTQHTCTGMHTCDLLFTFFVCHPSVSLVLATPPMRTPTYVYAYVGGIEVTRPGCAAGKHHSTTSD